MADRAAIAGSSARRALAALALVALPLAGCGGARLAPADAAARVGDETIPYVRFEEYVSGRVGLDSATSSLVLSGLLDQFLDEILLRTLARDEGRIVDGAAGWQVVDVLLESRQEPPVSEEEIRGFYATNPDVFARPERVLLNQALAEDSATAGELAERLAVSEDFTALASRFGDRAIVSQGEITRDDLPAAFADRIFSLAPGEVSEVIAADYGFHVFQVVARLPEERSDLDEARPRILELLARQGRRRALDELVAEARGRYNVEVFARNLPFNYEGQYELPNP